MYDTAIVAGHVVVVVVVSSGSADGRIHYDVVAVAKEHHIQYQLSSPVPFASHFSRGSHLN